MANRRDNFTPKTKELLAKRAGYLCSNPNCRKPTIGATLEPNKWNNKGIAAHICAAAKGGPRYDESMTSQKRSHASNGIWLCSDCATVIDNDEKKYTVQLLHEWKKDAENESMTRLAVVGTSQVRAYDIALRSTLFCKSPGRKPSRSPASTAGRVRISVLCAMLRSSSFPG